MPRVLQGLPPLPPAYYSILKKNRTAVEERGEERKGKGKGQKKSSSKRIRPTLSDLAPLSAGMKK